MSDLIISAPVLNVERTAASQLLLVYYPTTEVTIAVLSAMMVLLRRGLLWAVRFTYLVVKMLHEGLKGTCLCWTLLTWSGNP